MAPSDGHDVEVALDALQADSAVWQAAADNCRVASAAAATITLTAAQFSFSADQIGVTRLYGQLQQRVGELLAGAEANFTGIARTLLTTLQDYEATEQQNASSFTSLHH
jgi:hypothetical protein